MLLVRFRTLFALALVGVAIAAVPPRPAAAALAADPQAPRFYLAWHAPYGRPGATLECSPSCGDSTRRDTLYLSFEPAADESMFTAIKGEIYFYAQPNETLGTFWDMEHGAVNNGGLRIEFAPQESFPEPAAWPVGGAGISAYDRTRQSGRFQFMNAVAPGKGMAVKAGQRYVLARILIKPRASGLTGCSSPVCIEWRRAWFTFALTKEVRIDRGGSRFVTRGPAAQACRERVPGWRPPGAHETPDIALPTRPPH